MPAEGLDWLPGPALLTDDELARLISIAVPRPGHHRGPLHRWRAAAAPRPARASSPRTAALRPRPEISLTTNGIGLARLRRAAAPRPGWTGSTSRSTPCPPDLRHAHPPRPAARRAGGPSRRGRRRADAGQGQRGADARHQRPRSRRRCCGSAWTAATSCGSSSRCRWTPSTAGGGRTWSPPMRSWRPCRHSSRSLPTTLRPADRPRRDVPGQRRPRPRRRHRLGHPTVLRCMRPGPADRRRPGPQLPVRQRRDRPAHPAARRSRRRPAGRSVASTPSPPSFPATASTIPASCSLPGRCQPSAADLRTAVLMTFAVAACRMRVPTGSAIIQLPVSGASTPLLQREQVWP